MYKIATSMIAVFVMASSAYADKNHDKQKAQVQVQAEQAQAQAQAQEQKVEPTNPNVRLLKWADFKNSCANPAQFQAQRPPQDIKIVCKDLRFSWVNADAGAVKMPASRTVTSEVYSDKYHVSVDQNQIASDDSVGACSRYKEQSQTISTERAVTCDEILAFQGDLQSYCAGVTDGERTQNAAAIQVADTGRVIDTCPHDVQQAKRARCED